MDYLKNKHSDSRDEAISLDEATHIYTVNNQTDYTSVTTFVHSHFSEFDTEQIITNMMNGKNWSKSKYYNMTRDEIKNMWENNRNEAAEAGTKLHLDIEKHFNNVKVNNKSIEYNQFKKYKAATNYKNPYRTEWTIWDEDHKIAGSIDMIYENDDGSLEICDWKRSKQIFRNKQFEKYAKTECINHLPDLNFWHYALQLNVYKSILERKYNKNISKLFLVVFHPTKSDYEIIEIPELEEEINNLLSIRKLKLKH